MGVIVFKAIRLHVLLHLQEILLYLYIKIFMCYQVRILQGRFSRFITAIVHLD